MKAKYIYTIFKVQPEHSIILTAVLRSLYKHDIYLIMLWNMIRGVFLTLYHNTLLLENLTKHSY